MDNVVKDVLVSARAWARAREKIRRLSDSKSAKEDDLEKAKKDLVKCSDALYKIISKLETVLSQTPKTKKAINWHKFFGAVGTVAKAVGSAVAPDSGIIRGRVIDTTAEDVDR